MSSRLLQLWVWWLLPFLVARALVPVGFMAQATSHGQLQIVFCQSGAPQLAAVLHQVSDDLRLTDSDSPANDSDATHWQHDACAFGHLSAAPVMAFHGGDELPAMADASIVIASQPPYQAIGPPRVITNRGPPSLTRSILGA